MNYLKTTPKYLVIIVSMIVTSLAALIRAVAAQGADGTGGGTPSTPSQGFVIDPISLLIGLAGGAIAVGVPVLARVASRRRTISRKGIECDDNGNGLESIASKPKKRPGRESPTLSHLRESPTEPSRGGVSEIGDSSSAVSKIEALDSNKHTKTGHVTLMK